MLANKTETIGNAGGQDDRSGEGASFLRSLPDLTAWRPSLLGLVFAILWLLWWYGDTAMSIVQIWARSDTFASGFVVPFISVWLVWRDRERILAQRPVAKYWVLLLVLLAGGGWLLGRMANANSPSQLSLTMMLVLLVPVFMGWRVTRVLFFPLLFLFFAVPAGDILLPYLMSFTADFTVSALRLTGVPVYREGMHMVIPSGRWSVVEACSGIRYLIASLMVGTLYAYLNYQSLSRRIGFVVVSALVPLVANWVRAYLIVLLGHVTNNRLAAGVDHIIYGWFFFGVVMALMFWVGSFWQEDTPPTAKRGGGAVVDEAHQAPSWVGPSVALVLAMMVTAAPRLWYEEIYEHVGIAAKPRLVAPEVPGWVGREGTLTSWQPRFQWAAGELFQVYQKDGQEVGMYLGYYRNQTHERKMVSSDNVVVASQDPVWIRLGRRDQTVRYQDVSLKVEGTELLNSRQEQKLRIWKWYWIGGYLTNSDLLGKLYTSLVRILGQGDDSAVLMVYARFTETDSGEATMASFIQDAAPAIERLLSATREQR